VFTKKEKLLEKRILIDSIEIRVEMHAYVQRDGKKSHRHAVLLGMYCIFSAFTTSDLSLFQFGRGIVAFMASKALRTAQPRDGSYACSEERLPVLAACRRTTWRTKISFLYSNLNFTYAPFDFFLQKYYLHKQLDIICPYHFFFHCEGQNNI